jgi:catechol 2,3-dioxygenase-like lactoylglutathione lyase family enzyme
MFDHIGFPVSDLARSRAFYERALAPLGLAVRMQVTREQSRGYEGVGFGPPNRPSFWIGNGAALRGQLHLAFVAPDRRTVDAFHRVALAAGATDNGAPGLRAHYHPNYYGAFVLDPDGHNIEAVCHAPEA